MYQEMQNLTNIVNQLHGGYFVMIFFYSGYKAIFLAVSAYKWMSLGIIVRAPHNVQRAALVSNLLDRSKIVRCLLENCVSKLKWNNNNHLD